MVDISIIVPAYNVGSRIKATLESLFAQKTKYTYEILCIDGPSTDDTRAIVESLAKDHPSLIPINYEEKNLLGARRLGLSKASGRYITFCDGDDVEADNAIETLVSSLEKSGADMVSAGFYYRKRHSCRATFFRRDKEYDQVGIYKALLKDTYVRAYLWCKAFRREVFDGTKIPVIDHNVYREDAIFNFAACRKVKKAITVKTPIYYYDKTGDSGFSGASKLRIMDFVRVLAYERYTIEKLNNRELLDFFRKMKIRRFFQVRFDLFLNKKAFTKEEYRKAKRYIRDCLKLLSDAKPLPIVDEPWEDFIAAGEGE
ncbi:MAG: glycosyltransferase family 2 protein [Bacilli bacterium]|nr:glycosyltransferase family 2 protein [Bacilli bacterium]